MSGGSPGRLTGRARQGWRLARRTVAQAWKDRVLGLSAEAGFWALLLLTPLLLVLVAGIGYLTPLFGTDVVADVEARILAAAEQVLAPSAISSIVVPSTPVRRTGDDRCRAAVPGLAGRSFACGGGAVRELSVSRKADARV